MGNVNTTDFIQSHTKIYEDLTLHPTKTDTVKLNEEQLNAIETLAKLDGRNYLSRAIEHAVQILQQNGNHLQIYSVPWVRKRISYFVLLVEHSP